MSECRSAVTTGEQGPEQTRVRGLTPRVEPNGPQGRVDAVSVAPVVHARGHDIIEQVQLQLPEPLPLQGDPLLLPAREELEVESVAAAREPRLTGAHRDHLSLQVLDVDDHLRSDPQRRGRRVDDRGEGAEPGEGRTEVCSSAGLVDVRPDGSGHGRAPHGVTLDRQVGDEPLPRGRHLHPAVRPRKPEPAEHSDGPVVTRESLCNDHCQSSPGAPSGAHSHS